MGATQFDRPARTTIQNTYVPLNLDFLMNAINSRKQSYEQGLARVGQTESILDSLNAIPGSPDEATLNTIRDSAKAVLNEYADKDLSDPFVIKELNTKVQSIADPSLLSRIDNSYKSYLTGLDYRAKLGDKYNPLLDKDNAKNWDSTKGGVYTFDPRNVPSYMPKENYLSKYFAAMAKPRILFEKGADMYGRYKKGRTAKDVEQIVGQYADEYAATPSGQHELDIWHQQNPNDDRPESEIIKDIMREYGNNFTGIYDFTTQPRLAGPTSRGRATKPLQPYIPYNPGLKDPSKPGTTTYSQLKKSSKQLGKEIDDLTPGTPEYDRKVQQKKDLDEQINNVNNSIRQKEESFRKQAIDNEMKETARRAYESGLYNSEQEAYDDLMGTLNGMTPQQAKDLLGYKVTQGAKEGVRSVGHFFHRLGTAPGSFFKALSQNISEAFDPDLDEKDNKSFKEHYSDLREDVRNRESDAPYANKNEFYAHALYKTLKASAGYSGVSMLERRNRYKDELANEISTDNVSTYTALDLGQDRIGNLEYVTSPDGKGIVKSPWSAYADYLLADPTKFNIIQDKFTKNTRFNEYLKNNDVEITNSNMVMDPGGTVNGTTTPKIEYQYETKDKKGNVIDRGTFMIDISSMTSNMLRDLRNTLYGQGRKDELYHLDATTEERIPDQLYQSEITKDKPLYIESQFIPYNIGQDDNGEPIMVPYTYKIEKADGGKYKAYVGYRYNGKEYFEPLTDASTNEPVVANRNTVLSYLLQDYSKVRSQLDYLSQMQGMQ